jgi:hypothetical protein
MSAEQILKLQPDRTLYLRGFDGTGAAAALCQTSPTGFTVCGVFRDMADFCVLVLHDADNIFEHYSVRYLPSFDLSGMVLNFSLSYQGLQPIDSAKFSWVDWATLDVINSTGVASTVRLWDYATLASGNYSVAQGVYTFSAPGGCYVYDRLTLFVNNAQFDFVSYGGGESAGEVARWFAATINSYNWASFASSSVAVIASADDSGDLTLKNARTGLVTVDGTSVEWVASIKFPGIAPGSTIYLAGVPHTVAAVNSATSLTLTAAAPAGINIPYLAEYGGSDGNGVAMYMVVRPGNINLKVDNPILQLAGGNSDNVVWNISLDFSALGIDQIRQAWLTFAPVLSRGLPYSDTEWTATFSDWSVSDPNNNRTLQIAGLGSLRIGNDQSGACAYSGGWNVQPANNYWHGFAQVTSVPGTSVTVSYTQNQTHDLYLGTSLYLDRGIVGVTLDGSSLPSLDCYLKTGSSSQDPGSEVVTRRLLVRGVAAGVHSLTLTLTDAKNAGSSGFNFIFDYLEAALPTTDIGDPVVTYDNVSPALDFDTDATYKMSPQRLLWHILKLGFRGQLNEYLGVFWWNQRKRVGATWNSAVITVAALSGGTWTDADSVSVSIGGFTMYKSLIYWDTAATIAQHFVDYINSASVSMRAELTGDGQFTIYTRTPNWGDTLDVHTNSTQWTISNSGTLDVGVSGEWQVDPSASNPINFPARQWHADLFKEVKAADLLITTAFSMELVYPPDDGTVANCWQARFYDGSPVATDTGFAHLLSSQCSFVANMTAFQSSVFTSMAGLQSAAGLTPWLQFGEFLWWFYSSTADLIFSCSATAPATLQLQDPKDATKPIPHGMQTGDRIVVSGALGCTALNGTWPITVVDATQFAISVSPDGAWTSGTGQVRGGSMAYYDPVTSAAAQSALGRPLYKFTCQDDDPAVNGGADTAFLAGRLKDHVDAIRSAVLAQYPDAKFEILYPNDVNNPVCLLGPGIQYPQGGRLNPAVNLPPEWLTKEGSGLDRFKVEALSWGATYLNLELASQAIVFALTSPMTWNLADVAYLIPWFNGTCPWPREFKLASSRGLAVINLWAYDHLALMSWPLPFPTWLHRSSFLG